MTTTDKLSGLREILALDPRNSFARYGIAMELVSQGDIEAGLAEYDQLLEIDPDYVAAYFMSAQTLAAAGRIDEAKARLETGIGCAARAGNKHAMNEMQATLDELSQ
jgi:tetratricopeptide (TPR) repeat protein